MNHDDAVNAVFQRLWKGLELTWKVPPRPPKNPVAARPTAAWKSWAPQHPTRLHRDAPNWFYASLVFPETLHGHRLAGAQAYIYINGYCPFTLWLDGRELYREEHVWYATGPLADPIVTTIEPEGPFWEAEPEHQDYLIRYPNGYTCHFPRAGWVLPAREA